jgi:hypothetical protein
MKRGLTAFDPFTLPSEPTLEFSNSRRRLLERATLAAVE